MKNIKYRGINRVSCCLTLWFSLWMLVGCSSSSRRWKREGVPLIVVTTSMITDAVHQVVGEAADVVSLMGPGVDPHLYKATQRDVQAMQEADIIFYNGLLLEGKMQHIFEKLAKEKVVVAVAGGLPKSSLRTIVMDGHALYDPHVWFDILLWQACVRTIAETMTRYDTQGATRYQGNTVRYLSQLDSLHAWVQDRVGEIPSAHRLLITSHDAFSYFGGRYGMEIKALQGISTQADFGLKDVTMLVQVILARKIKAIFLETSVSERAIHAVLEGVLARGHAVRIGGTLYSDAMGEAGTATGNYIGMVQFNVNTIVDALK